MRDSEIVASIVAGEADGLAQAYDRYADALFGYCRSLLREPADAADAVQDTFVIAASRVSGLRDPELLRPWLYAVARNECLRRLGSREVASAIPGEAPETAEQADETADVGAEAERAETRALLRAALGGLNSAERDVVTQFLHGLDIAEIALVLDVSRNHVHALLSRARDQLEASVGVLLVARSGREACPELDALLAGWDGQLTVLLRKRAARHIERCDICSGRRRQVLSPAMLLGLSPGLLLGVFAAHAAPAGLRASALHMATGKDLAAEAYRGALNGSHGSFRTSGFPKPLHSGHAGLLRSRRVQVAVAAGAAAVVIAAVVLATSGGPRPGRIVGGGPPPGRASAGQTPGGAPGRSAGATPSGGVSRRGSGGRSSVPGSSLASASASGGAPAPSASPGASRTPSAVPSGTGSPSPSASPTGSRSASPTPTPTGKPAAGTLSVTPVSIVLTPLLGSTLTLTAEGGPVNWSISEPASLLGELDVSPSSGTLSAGQSTQVTITVSGLASLDTQLTVSPGGQAVTVLLGLLLRRGWRPAGSVRPAGSRGRALCLVA
jgi:RNA polymerase sigma factor (sigma-70 family)